MPAKEKYQYLSFIVKVLKFFCLWPLDNRNDELKWRDLRTYLLFLSTAPTMVPALFEIYYTFHEDDVNSIIRTQTLLANICVWSMYYMAACFIANRMKIKKLVNRIATFEIYTGDETIAVDQKVAFYSKCFMAYSLSGLVIYCAGPLMDLKYCEEHKYASMEKWGISCLTLVKFRIPFRYDRSPYQDIGYIHQCYIATLTVAVVVALTLLICGITQHVINQLRNLRQFALKLCHIEDHEELRVACRFLVKYHIFIIDYFDDVNAAFGAVMILHVTLTSFVISVLCFEIVILGTTNHHLASIRFALHLFGWLVILYLICYYGQRIVDESIGVAIDVYSTPWHQSSVEVQKDILFILARSQKPLTLKALSYGTMSAETFLAVLRAAYSYFTLLIHLI